MIISWICHICGERKPDRLIAVLSYPLKDLLGATGNVRYCKDKPECYQEALKWREKGEFPSYSKDKQKKWWQFWK